LSKYILPTKITFLFEKIQTCPLFFFHTSYKYVSLLIVGRGGIGKNTNRAPNKPEWKGGVMGGNGGMIAFKKNLLISKNGSSGALLVNEIDFTYNNAGHIGLYVHYSQSLGQKITAFLGHSSNGIDETNDYWEFALNGEIDSDLFYYGRTEGGLATSVLTAGSGGTYGNGEQTTSTAKTVQGGEGGDGRLGTQGPDYNTGIKAIVTIPIQSIFGGTGKGGPSYYNSTTSYLACGGGGYGDANFNGTAGYGAGGTCFKDSQSVSYYSEGAGIVLLCYHNDVI
jgi:hypothetical protein